MAKKKKKKKVINNNKASLSFLLKLLTLLALATTCTAIYEIFKLTGVEDNIRFGVVGLLIVITIFTFVHTNSISKKIKRKENHKSR